MSKHNQPPVKHSRVSVSRKYGSDIRAYITHEEIGAEMQLEKYQQALALELSVNLPNELVKLIGNPTFMFTKKGLGKAIDTALACVVLEQIGKAHEQIIQEMKQATVAVAALNLNRPEK